MIAGAYWNGVIIYPDMEAWVNYEEWLSYQEPDVQEGSNADGEDIVVVANLPPPSTAVNLPLPADPDPNIDDEIIVFGDTCPTARDAYQTAIATLLSASPTMASVIQAAGEHSISVNLIRADNSGMNFIHFNRGTMQVSWDPFSAVSGFNRDGATWAIPPVLTLAHELLHWAMPDATEQQVIDMSNRIASELNHFYNVDWYSTIRDNHSGSLYIVGHPNSPTFSLVRPGCG